MDVPKQIDFHNKAYAHLLRSHSKDLISQELAYIWGGRLSPITKCLILCTSVNATFIPERASDLAL